MRGVLFVLLGHGALLLSFLACFNCATAAVGEPRDVLMAGSGLLFAGVLASLYVVAHEAREALSSERRG